MQNKILRYMYLLKRNEQTFYSIRLQIISIILKILFFLSDFVLIFIISLS